MKNRIKKLLEFDKIQKKLIDKAATSLGKEKAESIDIFKDINIISSKLEETEEAFKILAEIGEPPLGGIHKVSKEVDFAVRGRMLNPGSILEVGDTLRAARNLHNFYKNNKDDFKYKTIENLIINLRSNKWLEDKIEKAIISEEEISDNASNDLKKIRKKIDDKNSSIRNKLNSIISSSDNQKYLQDSIITIRNDRFVILVKQEHRNKIKGLIHGQSSSGATLFIEPSSIVELNSDISNLKIEEKKEIERILKELSQDIATFSVEIYNNERIFKELDFIFAKGKLSLSYTGAKPSLNTDGYINIKKGRHPLIQENEVVPIDVYLGDENKTLVITGPNTGGKTVTLKTIGLFTLMTQAGLHIPASFGSNIGIFNNVFADIGDEQSIEQSLSTFSSHMTNIVEILKEVDSKSLVLLDEIGAGTDPEEGAALAITILEKLLNIGCTTAATTHYSELKIYALTQKGVQNGSVEFDIKTLSPTYRVLIGVPGKSNAFEISRKLGLENEIIYDAKNRLQAHEIEFEDALAKIETDRKASEKERLEIEKLKKAQEEIKSKLQAKEKELKNKEERMIHEAKKEARQIVEKAKNETADIIRQLRELNFEIEKEKNIKINQLRNDINSKTNEYQSTVDLSKSFEKSEEELEKGDYVLIRNLKQKGTIISEVEKENEKVTVQVGSMKLNVDYNSLKKLDKEDQDKKVASGSKNISLMNKRVKSSIDVREFNLEEAFLEVDKYLDDAYLAGLNEVSIIHGKGKGILRKGIGQYLKGHNLVKEFRVGSFEEGGDGNTIVKLKQR
ncbi:MAG: endonuclease MutS2 [Bacillota bacterium]|nr:endonuclease MutS2 [Bacillota bacterium]